MVLVFGDFINNMLIQRYETTVKVLILFGFFMLSIYYTKYVHPRLNPSKYFFVGTIRLLIYTLSYLWMFLFFLVMPVMIHPNVGIDNILIFLTSIYSIAFFVLTAVFIANAYFIVPEWVINISKIDLNSPEKKWLKNHYMRYVNRRNRK